MGNKNYEVRKIGITIRKIGADMYLFRFLGIRNSNNIKLYTHYKNKIPLFS